MVLWLHARLLGKANPAMGTLMLALKVYASNYKFMGLTQEEQIIRSVGGPVMLRCDE